MLESPEKPRLFQALGAVLALSVLGVVGWMLYSTVSSQSSPEVVVFDAPAVVAPKSPSEILNKYKSAPAEVKDWLTRWESAPADAKPNSEVDLATLKAGLEKADIPAGDLLAIGKFMQDGSDRKSMKVWNVAAIYRVKKEVDAEDGNIELVIRPIQRPLKNAENQMWSDPDPIALETLFLMIMPLKRTAEWDQEPEWRRLGYGDALYLQSRPGEALLLASALDEDIKTNRFWTDEQKLELRWLRILSYFDEKRYADVVTEMEFVGERAGWQHQGDARALLILSLVRLNRMHEAELAYTKYFEEISKSILCAQVRADLQTRG